jgi:hypothetical protein
MTLLVTKRLIREPFAHRACLVLWHTVPKVVQQENEGPDVSISAKLSSKGQSAFRKYPGTIKSSGTSVVEICIEAKIIVAKILYIKIRW